MNHKDSNFDAESVEAAILARNFFRVTMLGVVAFMLVGMSVLVAA